MKPTSRENFDAAHGVRADAQIHDMAVNVDDMNTADLRCVLHHPAIHQSVQGYAECVIEARKDRLAGNVDRALRIERKLDSLYEMLPQRLRW